MNKTRLITVSGMILAAAAARLLPHPPNFTPIAAIALFGGAQFSNRGMAFVVPFAAMFMADMLIGFHALMPFVYGSFALAVCLGIWLRQNRTVARTLLAALTGSMLFFVITNFAVWAKLGSYPATGAGLMACYVAAIPYFQNTVLGDLFYTAVLFGGLSFAQVRFAGMRECNAALPGISR